MTFSHLKNESRISQFKDMAMPLYPLFLDLTDKTILIVGAGRVGLRKTRGVIACGPSRILLVDPASPSPEISGLMAECGTIIYEQRKFEKNDIVGKSLVFAATDVSEVNARIADLCRKGNIFCNVADTPSQGDCQVPAHFHEKGVTVAVSTGGASPSLAAHLSRELEAFLHGKVGDTVRILMKLRPKLQAIGMTIDEKRDFYHSMIHACREQGISLDDKGNLAMALKKALPPSLHESLQVILHGF